MKNKVSVFLPCRKGSERVPKKNIKQFASYKKGLIQVKLNQLINCHAIDKIFLSTNDIEILDYASSLNCKKIIKHKRSEILSSNDCSTDSLIGHALDLIKSGHIMWTHVTSPFVNSKKYDLIIKKYHEVINNGYDSLMTINLLRGFLWDSKGPINYKRGVEKWPRTQTIESIFEVNSAVFIANAELYKKNNDRIGRKPYLYELGKIEGFDIDWNDDFEIAQQITKSGIIDL